MTHTLIATCKIGLEIIVKQELRDLGFEDLSVSPGRVDFEATADQIPLANIWLRTADRVRLRVGEFQATTFDDLFEQGVHGIPRAATSRARCSSG